MIDQTDDNELYGKVREIISWNGWTLSNEEAADAIMALIRQRESGARVDELMDVERKAVWRKDGIEMTVKERLAQLNKGEPK